MYRVKYKCRLCGEFFKDAITGKAIAEVSIFAAFRGENTRPMAPKMNTVHYCTDGGLGVADFIGFECIDDERRLK